MSVSLRILLFLASIMSFMYMVRKLRKSQIQIMDTIFWMGLSLILIILSIFPDLARVAADAMGFIAPVNFIFLVMIFLLMLRCFLLTIKVSQLDDKLKNLVEEIALKDNNNSSEDKKR